MRLYAYVGNQDLKALPHSTHRQLIRCEADAISFMKLENDLRKPFQVTTTFIVDAGGLLWIADRHSEHIACARGGSVQAAGEMTFTGANQRILEIEASNLSTGYCPKPECWGAVEQALKICELPHGDALATAYDFRRCVDCGMRNLVKDSCFECSVCGGELPLQWNF